MAFTPRERPFAQSSLSNANETCCAVVLFQIRGGLGFFRGDNSSQGTIDEKLRDEQLAGSWLRLLKAAFETEFYTIAGKLINDNHLRLFRPATMVGV